MAVTIPTLQELTDQILNDIAAEFSTDVNDLGITYQVQAKVQAGMIYQQYLGLSGVQKNIYYDLAEESVLIRYGEIILGRTPAPAEAGEYTIKITGEIGATITAGTQFKANDDTLAAGYLFVVDSDFELLFETDVIQIRALTPGVISALSINDLVTATSPIVDVNSEAEVLLIDKTPVAAESIEDYRADVVEASQIEPQAGSPGDYRLWSSEVPEVRNTYWYAKLGSPGDIEGYVEATEENTKPAEITGVPTQATIDEVYKNDNNIETGAVVINPITAKGRKPIGIFNVNILPVSPKTVDVIFTGLSDESVAETIRGVVDTLLYDIRPFVGGADLLTNKNDILTIGQIIAAVIVAISGAGIVYTTLVMEVDGVEVSEYQFLLGNYPYLRLITNNGSPI